MTKQTSKKTIYIEATALTRHKKTGVDLYAQGLMQALVNTLPSYEFVCFHFADTNAPLSIQGKNVREQIITPMSARSYRLLLLLGVAPSLERLLGCKTVDTVIFPNFFVYPVRTKSAKIYPVIYDTAYLDTPEYVAPRNRMNLRTLIPRGIKHSTRVLTISKATAERLEHWYRLAKDKSLVLYPAPPDPAPADTSMQLPQKFFLYVSTLEPRKNVANIIRAYSLLPAEIRNEYKLILAGGKGWMDDEIQSELASCDPAQVVVLGYVSDGQKAALYSKATAFVYPALFEGFGMPILEAQRAGVPVITSRNSSLPEAAGEVAVYVKPDAKSIAQGMVKIVKDQALRNRLIAAGKKHAQKFTWQSSAEKLAQVIRANETS